MANHRLPQHACVLTYHGVSHAGGPGTLRLPAFKRQMDLLSRTVKFVNLRHPEHHAADTRRRVLLTFDDGFHNNFLHVVPILRRLQVPAIFFLSDRHCRPNTVLWFSYLRALERFFEGEALTWRGKTYAFSPKARRASLGEIRTILLGLEPHPSAVYDAIEKELPPLGDFLDPDSFLELFAGMIVPELQQIAGDPLFSIGVHTSDHAFLTRCTQTELRAQITRNIQFIRGATSTEPMAIAYPSGDYDERVLETCRELKIPLGFAVIPHRVRGNELELGRIGIYSESLAVLMLKVYLGDAMRAARLQIG